ncbi:hypothetical protein WN51_05535 [Melipona quadrifasciata]|uniref:Uncharacterized protein n=1 Tax=Melipona quadrifasciata TaxID=166423 RepID=A0A0N0BCY0_9HYME|nr:hypothetical protein WN51_05535 [Melipona quadrifasciata]
MERCHVNNMIRWNEQETVVRNRKYYRATKEFVKTTVSVERFTVCNKVKFVGVRCENTRTRTSSAEVCRKEPYGTEARIGVHAFARKPRLTFRILRTQ